MRPILLILFIRLALAQENNYPRKPEEVQLPRQFYDCLRETIPILKRYDECRALRVKGEINNDQYYECQDKINLEPKTIRAQQNCDKAVEKMDKRQLAYAELVIEEAKKSAGLMQ